MAILSFFKRALTACFVFLIGAGPFMTATAAEIQYDITNCYQGEAKLVFRSDALIVLGFEMTGITQSNT